jgi:hypothetical protein
MTGIRKRGLSLFLAPSLVLAAVAMMAPLPVAAQQTDRLFTVPEGCTAFLSVQSRSCTVAHYWTCAADPAGARWRVSVDDESAFYLSYTDAEFRWLQNWGLRDGSEGQLVEPEEDPASMTELLETGTDSMVFSMKTTQSGGFSNIRNYTGFDSLNGDEVTVDGRTLLVTEFAYQYDLGDGPRRTQGNQFVHSEWRLFFGGVETVTMPDGETFEGNYSPVEFAEPGEPGFLSMTPTYDCGDIMSGFPIDPVPQG